VKMVLQEQQQEVQEASWTPLTSLEEKRRSWQSVLP
jgi:hypothetical protein